MSRELKPAQVVVDFIIGVMSRLPDETEETAKAAQRQRVIEISRLEELRDLHDKVSKQLMDIQNFSLVNFREDNARMGALIVDMERGSQYARTIVERWSDIAMRASVIRPLMQHFKEWTYQIAEMLDPFDHSRAVLNGLPIGVMMCTESGRVLDINKEGADILCHTRDELLNEEMRAFYIDSEQRLLVDVFEKREVITEIDVLCGDGTTKKLKIRARLFSQEGMPVSIVTFTENVG